MERIRPIDAPEDDEDAKRPERFSPYAVPLTTLVASVYVAQQDQSIVLPEPAPAPFYSGPDSDGD